MLSVLNCWSKGVGLGLRSSQCCQCWTVNVKLLHWGPSAVSFEPLKWRCWTWIEVPVLSVLNCWSKGVGLRLSEVCSKFSVLSMRNLQSQAVTLSRAMFRVLSVYRKVVFSSTSHYRPVSNKCWDWPSCPRPAKSDERNSIGRRVKSPAIGCCALQTMDKQLCKSHKGLTLTALVRRKTMKRLQAFLAQFLNRSC